MTDFLESFTPGLPEQALAAAPAPARRVWRHACVATLAGASGWGLIERGAVVTEGARIAWVGAEADLPALGKAQVEEHDLDGALLLLASKAGAYMTGAVIPVDGGQGL